MLSDVDRNLVTLALGHSWPDLSNSVVQAKRGLPPDDPHRQALDGLMAITLKDAEQLSEEERESRATIDAAERYDGVRRFLKNKGRLTHLVEDLGVTPTPSPIDSIARLAPGVGRLLVQYENGVADVLLDGQSWHRTGEIHRLEVGSYTVSLALASDSFAPPSRVVEIQANLQSTASFS